jgi:hypothetical protein
VVAVAECGTHAIVAATVGPITKAEATLAREWLPGLGKGQLLIADRGFAGLPLWRAASAGGADLLWRVRANVVLPVREELPDGSRSPPVARVCSGVGATTGKLLLFRSTSAGGPSWGGGAGGGVGARGGGAPPPRR